MSRIRGLGTYLPTWGEAGSQVDGARLGLAHNIGGPTAVAAVTILGNERG